MHVLVIEDNVDLVANLVDFLEAHAHAVDVAYDGRSGFLKAKGTRYDAVVLDLTLPRLDGLEVCRQLRAAEVDTPLLMLTARDTLNDKLEGFAMGADDYLVKPFALPELEARLAALARRRPMPPPTARLRVADLVFDPGTRQVQRAGQTITLPRTALQILEILMSHSPRVVTRQELERAIWGDRLPDSDALRTHLHVLRSAIDKPFDKPLLHTLHGVGYRLADEIPHQS